jgi:hypothetical protein
MPNIQDVLGLTAADEGESPEFDLDQMLGEVDTILAARHGGAEAPAPVSPDETPAVPVASESAGGESEVAVEDPAPPAPEPGGEAVGVGVSPLPAEPAAPPPVAPVQAVELDPFAQLPPERRAALLELDRTLAGDESKRTEIQRILLGQVAPEAPKLPPEIDPDSPEARLWLDNQELRAEVAAIAQGQERVTQGLAAQQQRSVAEQTAESAARTLSERYPTLTADHVMRIAQVAGQSGRAGALAQAPQYENNLHGAYVQSMEDALWATPELREWVASAPAPVPVSATPEAVERKRKLSALSSSASPVSAPAARSALETREDGRLTDTSRRTVVEQAAAALRQVQQGG